MPGSIPAATKAGGKASGIPDVCKVPAPPSPPVPTPFPNDAELTSATQTSTKVMAENKPMIVQTSELPMSSGDEGGSAGGVVSGKIKGEVKFKAASSKVFIEGKKAVMLGVPTAHNGSNANAIGAHLAPSQTKVLVSP